MIQVRQLARPQSPALSVLELREHLRVDEETEGDYLVALGEVARDRAEHYSQVLFGERQIEITLDKFQEIRFSDYGISPVVVIDSIQYKDKEGVTQTLSNYALVNEFGAGQSFRPVYNQTFPEVLPGHDSVVITLTAGYAVIPETVKAAMKMIAGSLYENREDESQLRVMDISLSSKALLDQIKRQGGLL